MIDELIRGSLDSPQFYAVAIPAVLITAVAKGGFGSGVGGLGVPLMSLAIAPPQAAAILLPILCLMDLFSWWAYRGKWDRSNMRIMLPAAMFGMALGTAMFGLLEPDHIRLMLGFIAVAFALDHWLRPKQPNPKSPNVGTGSFWSAAAGFTSFLAHSGGLPLSVYLLPQRLDRTVFVATSVFFFFVVNYVKLIPYAWLGLFDFTNLRHPRCSRRWHLWEYGWGWFCTSALATAYFIKSVMPRCSWSGSSCCGTALRDTFESLGHAR